ncbi:MAG: type I glyceraldehyde-3-phosphate dehydrogenase, partial [Parcubacteria group bacterium]|nr:type I glyceraldehyde-3-phosphate dehydrogenase [Parcubacteria group bacterium]
ALLVKMLDECAGIENGFMTTMHSYTNDQRLLDLPHKDLRRARAAALSIIPTTTGAAKTVGKVLKHLNGKLDGVSYRVPTPIVSIVDLTAQVKKSVTKQELNAYGEQYKKKLPNIFDFTTEPLVSSDFKGNTNSVIMDSELTYANGTFVKISGWYDNEYGYSKRLAEIATIIGKK